MGLTFGRTLRGDAEEARKVLKWLLSINSPKVRSSVLRAPVYLSRRLKVGLLRINVRKTHGILDTAAVSNLISDYFCGHLSLMPTKTALKGTVAIGTVTDVLGCVNGVPVSFRISRAPLSFLVVRNTLVHVIVESLALDALQACLDFSCTKLTLVVDAGEVLLPFQREPSLFDGLLAIDSEYFTSPEKSEKRQYRNGSEVLASCSAHESDETPELVLVIVTKES